MLDDATVGAEDGANADVELVLGSHVQLKLHLAHLLEDELSTARIVGSCSLLFFFLFSNKGFELLTCLNYTREKSTINVIF